MPNSGQILEATQTTAEYAWEYLVIKVGSSATLTSDDPDVTYGHGAAGQTDYVEDAINRLLGITLEVGSDWDGAAGSWYAIYDGLQGPLVYGAATYRSDVSIEVRIPNLKIYGRLTGSLLQIESDAWEIWVNGVLEDTFSSGVSALSTGVGPHYIQQIGIPLAISGDCSVDSTYFPTDPIGDDGEVIEGGLPPGFTYDPCSPAVPDEEATSEIESTVYGGWRFQVDGSWVDLPVSTNVVTTAGVGPFGISNAGIITATRTWGNQIACRDYRHYKFEYIGRENPTETSVQVTCDGVVVRTDTNASSGNSCIDDCTGLPGPFYRDLYKVTYETEEQHGAIRLIPDLERAIVRLGDDHASEYYRYPSPQTRYQAGNTFRDGNDIGFAVSNTEVHPSLSEFKELVLGDTISDFEEPLTYTAYAEVACQKAQGLREGYSAFYTEVCTCPWDWFVLGPSPCSVGQLLGFLCGATWPTSDEPVIQLEGTSFTFPSYVEDGEIGGVLIGGPMYHQDDLTRYFSTWCNPLWSMYYWTVQRHEVDASPVRWADYWGPVREQWFEDDGAQRNSVIATFTEDEQGNTPWLDAYTAPESSDPEDPNNGLRWIGMHRFKIEEFTVPANLTLSTTRPAEWAARVQDEVADCSVTLGAGGITLDDFEVAEAQVDCSLCNWDTDPYLLLALFQAVTLDWELTNVSAMEVVLVGWDGAETALMTTPSRVDVADLTPVQTKYAGSWAVDNGAGVTTDFGADTLPAGISYETMQDSPTRAPAFQLGVGRSWRYLRFRVTPIDTGLPVVIEWPFFEFPTEAPTLFWESGKCCALVWPDGPGIRWGSLLSYDPVFGWTYPPSVAGLGTASTIIDAKTFGRRVLQGDGGSSLDTTITSELGDLVDSLEGPASISVVDKFSLAFPLPVPDDTWDRVIRFAFGNSFAEMPPLCCFPTRKRNTTDWAADDDYWAGVYDWSQLQRLIVSAGVLAYIDSGTVDAPEGSEVVSGVPTGWKVWQYAPALNNTETNWRISVGTARLALVRPWHGFYVLTPGAGDQLVDWVSYHVSTARRHAVARGLTGGNVEVGISESSPSLAPQWVDAGFSATAGCVRWALSGGLLLWTVESGTVYQRESDDEGGSWSVATSIGAGTQVCACITPQRVRYIYRRTSAGAIVVQARDSANNVLISDTTVVASGVDNAAIDCDYRPIANGRFEIVLWYIASGTLTESYSNDGVVFS